MTIKVNQKHLFNEDGNKTITYTKRKITKEIKIQRLYIWLNEQIEKGDWHKEFEFGELQEHDIYDNNSSIVLANWNSVSKGIPDYIESLGIEIGWCDEYTTCTGCGKLMQTNPDCYGWISNYILTDCEILCRECIESDIAFITDNEYQDNYFINNNKVALPYWCIESIESEGFTQYNDESYESGFYYGQTDTPEKILDSIDIDISKYNYLWIIDSTGQFDIDFSLYIRLKEVEENE